MLRAEEEQGRISRLLRSEDLDKLAGARRD